MGRVWSSNFRGLHNNSAYALRLLCIVNDDTNRDYVRYAKLEIFNLQRQLFAFFFLKKKLLTNFKYYKIFNSYRNKCDRRNPIILSCILF